MKKVPPLSKLGFTLIELIVVFAIIGLIFTVGVGNYQRFNQKRVLEKAAQDLKTNLRLAQDKALAGEKPQVCHQAFQTLLGYKLKFEASPMLPFYGNYKITAVCDNNEYDVKTGLTLGLGVFLHAGPDEILFRALGQGAEGGDIYLVSYNKFYKITVSEGGQIVDEGFVTIP